MQNKEYDSQAWSPWYDEIKQPKLALSVEIPSSITLLAPPTVTFSVPAMKAKQLCTISVHFVHQSSVTHSVTDHNLHRYGKNDISELED